MPESLIRRNAEGLTQNTIANMISPYISPVATGMIVWVLTKLATISGWTAGWKVALIVAVAVGLTFLLHTLPGLLRPRPVSPNPDQLSPAPVVSESARLIELRDDLDVMRRERDTAQTSLKTCQAEHEATREKLGKCESLRRLEAGEVDRVRKDYQGQLDLAREHTGESNARVSELEQQLRVVSDKLDDFTTPPGSSLKIKRGEYHLPGQVGVDVGETLDRMIWENRLVLNRLYRTLFPDPKRGARKHLTIEFSHGTREFSVTVPEDTKLTLPFPYSDLE